ncbi:MAG: hypothetical protein O3B13_11870 [Planctomycetota bacterium]|nr:hypothetical protein [Planctomycetota bacterium]
MNRRPDTDDCSARDFDVLSSLGALPPAPEYLVYQAADSPTSGLLAVWNAWLRKAPRNRQSKAARIHSVLHAAIAAGAKLSFGLPDCSREVSESWLERRAYWWPHGVIQSRRIGIVSSRLRRDATANSAILKALRLSLTHVDAQAERLIVSEGTSLREYLNQCGTLFDLPVLRVVSPPDRESSRPWIEVLVQLIVSGTSAELLISPPVPPSAHAGRVSETQQFLLSNVPVRDRAIAVLSDRLFVLSLRRNGHWWKILQAGLRDGLWNHGSVRMVVGNWLCTNDIADELQAAGAVRWHLSADVPAAESTATADHRKHSHATSAVNVPPDRATSERELLAELAQSQATNEWLVHWTREARSEWAGESRDDYLKSILLSDVDADRSAYGTVQRIISEQVIRASSGNTRVGADTVSLSGIPLATLVTRRVFRRHRGRWDFEHYGIGIRATLVRAVGGRPVIYGDESTWRSLSEGERLWFHPIVSQSAVDHIDWSIEDEWRIAGDLRFGNACPEDVFIFCATEAEAATLRSQSQWRVISIEKLKSACSDDVDPDK